MVLNPPCNVTIFSIGTLKLDGTKINCLLVKLRVSFKLLGLFRGSFHNNQIKLNGWKEWICSVWLAKTFIYREIVSEKLHITYEFIPFSNAWPFVMKWRVSALKEVACTLARIINSVLQIFFGKDSYNLHFGVVLSYHFKDPACISIK